MKDNNKQTAVDYLVEKLLYLCDINIDGADFLIKAKQMEQEQIQEAWNNGALNWDAEMEGDDYYNETF